MSSLTVSSKSKSSSGPLLSFKGEEEGILSFTIGDINVSFINGIRRTILSDIPTLVFHCFPHDENDAAIHVNTTRLNNEVLKQRLSCIPIHISDLSLPYKELVVEINMKNDFYFGDLTSFFNRNIEIPGPVLSFEDLNRLAR